MGNFSKDPLKVLADNLTREYLGVHLQQGVPVLDRDINLMQDLLRSLVRQLAAVFLGNGILPSAAPPHDSFRISAVAGVNHNFTIAPGSAVADGVTVNLKAAINYTAQSGVPALTSPTAAQPDPRVDSVFLDVWMREVTAVEDSFLNNDDDIGIETSVRLQPTFLVSVGEGVTGPGTLVPGHVYLPLANLVRPRGSTIILPEHIVDARAVLVTLPDLSDRLNRLESVFNPVITSVTPIVQNVNNPVTINGSNFAQGTPVVTFIPAAGTGMTPLQGVVVSFNNAQITVTVPDFPGQNAFPPGIAMVVRVQTAIGSTDSGTITIVDSIGPTISAIAPALQNVGSNITITGTALAGATEVAFSPLAGLLPLPGFTPLAGTIVTATATTIVVTVPNFTGITPAAGRAMRVRVVTPTGAAENNPLGTTPLVIIDTVI